MFTGNMETSKDNGFVVNYSDGLNLESSFGIGRVCDFAKKSVMLQRLARTLSLKIYINKTQQ